MSLLIANSGAVQVPSGGFAPGEVTLTVNASSDDAHQNSAGGATDLTKTSLSLNTINGHYGFIWNIGFELPPTVTIHADTAFTGVAFSTLAGAMDIEIWAFLSAAPATFTAAIGDVSDRAVTTASVHWTPVDFTGNTSYTSPSLAAIIQEVLGSVGAITRVGIKMRKTGTNARAFSTWDHATHTPPRLFLKWT